MRALRIIRRLGRDERGLSVVELGLVAPVLALFIAGIIDLSQGLAQRFTMQQAINHALELALAQPPETDLDDDEVDFSYIVAEAAAGAGVDEEDVALDRWLQCDDQRMPNFTDSCASGEDSARYVSLEIEKPFTGNFFVGEITITANGAMRFQ